MILMFISNNLSDIRKAQKFAQSNKYQFKCCSVEKWNKNPPAPTIPTKPTKNTAYQTNNKKNNVVAMQKPWGRKRNFFNTLDELKIRAIRDALIICRGNVTKAAHILKVGRATLYRNTKILNIALADLRDYQENQTQKNKHKNHTSPKSQQVTLLKTHSAALPKFKKSA